MLKPIISADSHITEPPGTYVDRIDHKYKDTAPHMVRDEKKGDLFIIEGLNQPIPMGLVAAAGKKAEELTTFGAKFEELHEGAGTPMPVSLIKNATASLRKSSTRPLACCCVTIQTLTTRKLASMHTICGSPNTALPIPTV
jgi:hypothetical protein